MRPFPGLRPFGFEDREFFFGREDQIYSLYRLLEHSRFIAVVGSSGSGKSSLVRAGLLPVIEEESRGDGGRKWRFATLHPGDAPVAALASAVASFAQGTGEDEEIRHERTLFALRRSSFGLSKALDDISSLAGRSILLVVDQFEELFRYGISAARDSRGNSLWRDEAANFVQLLLEATRSRSSSVYVLITMRSDFIGDCSQFHGLPEAVSAAQFLVPSLTRDQREDVIRKPVEKVGATIDSTLVEVLLNEAGSEMDQLPVLQHCLSRLWDRAEPSNGDATRHLGMSEYDAIGGIKGALSKHADEVMASLPGLELAVEQVFRALSEVDKEGRATRRALPYSRLLAESGIPRNDLVRVLDRFRADDCSFLLPPPSAVPVLRADTRVDVVHEALLRRWERISAEQPHMFDGRLQAGWLNAEAADGRFYRALLALLETETPGAAVTLPLDQVEARWQWWKSRPRTEAWAERYGGRLKDVEKLFADSLAALSADRARRDEAERKEREQERRKIEAEEAAKRERLEHEAEVVRMRAEAAQRLTHRTRLAAFAMSLIAVVAVVLAIYAFQQKRVADSKTLAADSAKTVAEKATKRAQNETAIAQGALIVARAKTKLASTNAMRAQNETNRANAALKIAQHETARADAQTAKADVQRAIALDQTHQALAERSQVFLQRGRQALLDGDDNAAALLLAAAYQGDSQNPVLQPLLRQALAKLRIRPSSVTAYPGSPVTALAYSPDPRHPRLAIASTDGSVKLWSAGGGLIHEFNDQNDVITGLAFDPSGRYLVSVGRDGSAKLHDLAGVTLSSDPPAVALLDVKDQLEGHVGRVNSVVFSHNGSRILTSGSDGMIKLWSGSDGKMISEWHGAALGVGINSAAFSRDDRVIAACAADGTLAMWNSQTGAQMGSKAVASKSSLVHISISPSGNSVVAGALDGTILYFDAANGQSNEWHYQHAAINAISFDGTGERILSASDDGTVVLIDSASGQPQTSVPARPGAPAALTATFDPSTNGFETTYADGSLNLWTQEGQPVAVLQGPVAVAASYSPDGRVLATGSDRGIVDFWPLPPALARAEFSHKGAIESLEFDHHDRMLTASEDGTAGVWRLDDRPSIDEVFEHAPRQAWVVAAHFSADGQRVVTTAGNTVKVWTRGGSAPIATIHTTAPSKRFTQAAFVGRSYNIIVAQSDTSLTAPVYKTNGWMVWSADGKRQLSKEPGWLTGIRELMLTDDGSHVLAISGTGYAFFCPTDGADQCREWTSASEGVAVHDHFILGGVGGGLHLIDSQGYIVGSEHWQTNDSRVLTLAASADGRWLAAGGTGGSPGAIWGLVNPGQSHVSLSGGAGEIESASFSPGPGRFLLATFSDGTVRLWDRESGNILASASVPMSRATAAVFTPDGTEVIIGSQNGNVYEWPILGGLPTPRDAAALVMQQADHSHISDPLVTQAIGVLEHTGQRGT